MLSSLRNTLFERADEKLLQEVLLLATQAGSLVEFEKRIKQIISHGHCDRLIKPIYTINGRRGTLSQCIVIGLDQTIHGKTKHIEGMAECFLKILIEKLPLHDERIQLVIDQIKQAGYENEEKVEPACHPVLHTDDIPKTEKEEAHEDAIAPLFKAYIQQDEETIQNELLVFQEYLNKIKQQSCDQQGYLINNTYYRDLIFLNSAAFSVMEKFFDFVPPKDNDTNLENEETNGVLIGLSMVTAFFTHCTQNVPLKIKIAIERFCFEVIGKKLQADLPPMLIKLLKEKLTRSFPTLKNSQCNNTDSFRLQTADYGQQKIDSFFEYHGEIIRDPNRAYKIFQGKDPYCAISRIGFDLLYQAYKSTEWLHQYETRVELDRGAQPYTSS